MVAQDEHEFQDGTAMANLTDDEIELVVMNDQMIHESAEQTRRLLNRWVTALQYFRGDQDYGANAGFTYQSHGRRDPDRNRDRRGRRRKNKGNYYANAVVNRILPIVEQQISMMTDNNPKGVFLPQDDGDVDFTKDIEALTLWRARKLKMRTRLIRMLHNSKIFGFAAIYVHWDDTLPGAGDMDARLMDPRELIIDPFLQTTVPEDGEYIGIKRDVTLEYLKSKWPEKSDELDNAYHTEQDDMHRAPLTESNSLDAELGHLPDVNFHSATRRQGREMVTLTSLWYKDYTTKKFQIPTPLQVLRDEGKVIENAGGEFVDAKSGELWNEENSPMADVEEPAYPFGRHTIKAGNIILEDFAWGEDYATGEMRHASWPIALNINMVIPMRWYGMDETEALQGDQDNLNDMASMIKDHALTVTRPRRVVDVGAIKDMKSINRDSGPDQTIKANPGRVNDAIRWEPAGRLSPDVYNWMTMSERNMETTSGMPAQSMGRQSPQKQTATEIATLDRAGRGRVGMASSLLDDFIARVYMLIAEGIQQNYAPNRMVRILGENTEARVITITQKHKTVRFDVEVEAGSTLPFDKERKKEDALAVNQVLMTAGPYLPEVLDAYEVKNRDEVLQRSQQWVLFVQYGPLLQLPEVQEFLNAMAVQVQQAQEQQGGQPQSAGAVQ